MLPPIVRNTYPGRQRKFLDAAERGLAGWPRHLPPCGGHCAICGRPEAQGLYRVPHRDGTVIDVGPDCLEGLRRLHPGNIEELRQRVGPELPFPAGVPS